MKISQFFEKKLGANLRNTRWSWGAVDPVRNIVFLRIWDDQISKVDGVDRVHVYWKNRKSNSPGFKERQQHIAAIENGAEAVGVICKAVDLNPDGARSIKEYQESPLVLLGDLVEDDTHIYAEIIKRVSSDEIAKIQTGNSTIARDLFRISRRKVDKTVKEALVNARVGQGQFRSDLLRLWNRKCAVTGVGTLEVIRASHIKPWSESNDDERLDPENGIPLMANLDALFDEGLISFEDSGEMLVSSKLSKAKKEKLNLDESGLSRSPGASMKDYLEFHRSKKFKK